MLVLPGYEITETINQSKRTHLFRGIELSTQQNVIIKATANDQLSETIFNQFKHEYEIAHGLDKPHIVRYLNFIVYSPNGAAIIQQDDRAISLAKLIQHNPISITIFLKIAIQLAQGLHEIHTANLIHHDIKPSNILIALENNIIKYTDFGSASRLRQESQSQLNPEQFEGTLAYISPEQTGRINRFVDYRTDFYSLGVTLYQILTRHLPFDSQDPLELIHAHIAKKPKPPHEIRSDVPEIISHIIIKLLAKNAEDRYQSCQILQKDLERCLQAYEDFDYIEPFDLAEGDFSEDFRIPQKLYGRDQELASLEQAFAESCQSSIKVITVAGSPGVGKTALVNELQQSVNLQNGYFISGKFDQLNRNVTYSAIIQAFRYLIKQLLSESKARIEYWKKQLLQALKDKAQLLIELIPELEILIGTQPPVLITGSTEAENRFNLVFQNFIKVFCQPNHPLVLFLDDLQWADLASLKLIKMLSIEANLSHCLLILTYRDNEVNAIHPAMMILKEIGTSLNKLESITLTALEYSHVNQCIAETLDLPTATTQPLAEVIYAITKGNPFYIKLLLQSLYDEHILARLKNNSWQWDIEIVGRFKVNNNILTFLLQRTAGLPEDTKQILKTASCLGNYFLADTLASATQKTVKEIADKLEYVLNANLLYQVDKHYYFAHDRVQEAFYSLLSEQEKAEKHIIIAKLLLAQQTTSGSSENLFIIVDHFNKCKHLIKDRSEKIQLAQLNFDAGIKAKKAIAYMAAVTYLTASQQYLVDIDIWHEDYTFAFNINKELAEANYLAGNFDIAAEIIKEALSKATALDKIELYNISIIEKTMRGQYDAAIDLGRIALKHLSISLPTDDVENITHIELESVKKQLKDKEIIALLNLPAIQNPEKKAALKTLFNLYIVGYLMGSDLLPIFIIKMVDLSLNYGHAPESCMAYAAYGMLLCSISNDYEKGRKPEFLSSQSTSKFYQQGYEFGLLAIQLSEKFNDQVQKCRSYNLIINCIYNWSNPLHTVNTLVEEGYQAGIEAGELQYVGYICQYKARSLFEQGVKLINLIEESNLLIAFSEKTKNQVAIDLIVSVKIIAENLAGQTTDIYTFQWNNMPDDYFLQHCQDVKSVCVLPLYYIMKAQVLYLYEEFTKALENLKSARTMFAFIPGQFAIANHNWYSSLTLTALYLSLPKEKQRMHWDQIEENQQHMQEWAHYSPKNFQHKYLLVEAEKQRILNKPDEAIKLYDQAIELAEKQGFIQDEALACELAAKCLLAAQKNRSAKGYMQDAYKKYLEWGAKRKGELLKAQYSNILESVATDQIHKFALTEDTTISLGHLKLIDLASIIRTSQIISSEIELEKLLISTMSIIVKNAGAEIGALLFESATGLIIAAEFKSTGIINLSNSSLEQWESGSRKVVEQAMKTKQTIIIGNASIHPLVNNEPSVKKAHTKSILCMPIIKKNSIQAIFYAENNQTIDAFTAEHIELLSVLVSQVAISLENAKFIRNREQLAEQYQTTLQELIDMLCHETRNPANVIFGYIDFIKKELQDLRSSAMPFKIKKVLTDKTNLIEKHINTIKNSAKAIKSVTDNVLDINKFQSGNITFQQKPVHLKPIIESATETFMPKLEEKAVKLLFNCSDDLWLMSDPDFLKIIINNLIDNAIKFTTKASQINVIIKLDTSKETGQPIVVISIEDQGSGMTSAQIDKLFQRFSQPVSASFSQYQGMGLGLIICKRLVTQMQGKIEVESSEGKGTTFKIEIPYQAPKVQARNSPKSIQKKLNPTQVSLLSPKYILIVEDNIQNQTILKRILEAAHHTCTIANDGSEAVTLCHKNKFDIIFMDIQMPVMDGLEATQKIRANEKKSGQTPTPIIGLSADARNEHKKTGLDHGMNAYLTKPFNVRAIHQVIAELTDNNPQSLIEPVSITPYQNQHIPIISTMWKKTPNTSSLNYDWMVEPLRSNLYIVLDAFILELRKLDLQIQEPASVSRTLSSQQGARLYTMKNQVEHLAILNVAHETDADKIINSIVQSNAKLTARKIKNKDNYSIVIKFSNFIALQEELNKVKNFLSKNKLVSRLH